MVLGGFVGGFGWFWVVLGGFGWFRVLVTTHATHVFGLDGFENLDFVLNKAAEISTRVFSFFFFFVISAGAGFLHREPIYFLCRFRYRRNKTACSILWHSLSKFALSFRV